MTGITILALRAREMAQQVQTPAALAEDLGFVHRTHVASHNQRISAFFWPLLALHIHDTQTYM